MNHGLFSDKENMVAPFGRQATLTMIISYNDSDWTTGWNHLLKGATMFLTPSYEQVWARLHIHFKPLAR